MNVNRDIGIARAARPISIHDWILKLSVTLARSVRIYRTIARQYRELEELPDYLLRDVGLERDQVSQARRNHRFRIHSVYWP